MRKDLIHEFYASDSAIEHFYASDSAIEHFDAYTIVSTQTSICVQFTEGPSWQMQRYESSEGRCWDVQKGDTYFHVLETNGMRRFRIYKVLPETPATPRNNKLLLLTT